MSLFYFATLKQLAKLSSIRGTLCHTCCHSIWYQAATKSAKFTALRKQLLRVLKREHVPQPLGNLSVSQEQLVKHGTSFIGVCYGNSPSVMTMSEHRFLKWKNVTKGKGRMFRLENLPPTSEAFALHIKRADYLLPCGFVLRQQILQTSIQHSMAGKTRTSLAGHLFCANSASSWYWNCATKYS